MLCISMNLNTCAHTYINNKPYVAVLGQYFSVGLRCSPPWSTTVRYNFADFGGLEKSTRVRKRSAGF